MYIRNGEQINNTINSRTVFFLIFFLEKILLINEIKTIIGTPIINDFEELRTPKIKHKIKWK